MYKATIKFKMVDNEELLKIFNKFFKNFKFWEYSGFHYSSFDFKDLSDIFTIDNIMKNLESEMTLIKFEKTTNGVFG